MNPTSANIITVLGLEVTARALEIAAALLWTAGTCWLAFRAGQFWERIQTHRDPIAHARMTAAVLKTLHIVERAGAYDYVEVTQLLHDTYMRDAAPGFQQGPRVPRRGHVTHVRLDPELQAGMRSRHDGVPS